MMQAHLSAQGAETSIQDSIPSTSVDAIESLLDPLPVHVPVLNCVTKGKRKLIVDEVKNISIEEMEFD